MAEILNKEIKAARLEWLAGNAIQKDELIYKQLQNTNPDEQYILPSTHISDKSHSITWCRASRSKFSYLNLEKESSFINIKIKSLDINEILNDLSDFIVPEVSLQQESTEVLETLNEDLQMDGEEDVNTSETISEAREEADISNDVETDDLEWVIPTE